MPALTTIDGARLAVHELGGHGRALVLAHATGFHGHIWEPLATLLAHRFRCLAFDQRGHGDSGLAPGQSFDWQELAEDVLAVVDGMGLDRPFGFGHSSGAALLLLAEESRPGTFEALFCFEPIVAPADDPPPPDPERPLVQRALKRRDVFPGREEALAYLAARPAFAALDDTCLRAYVTHGFEDLENGSVRLKCRPETEARYYEHGLAHGAFRRLERVSCPVVLACGEETDAVGADVLEMVAARLAQARIQTFPGLGHFGPLEDPAAVARAMDQAFT